MASWALSQQKLNQPQLIPPKFQKTKDGARQRPLHAGVIPLQIDMIVSVNTVEQDSLRCYELTLKRTHTRIVRGFQWIINKLFHH